MSSSEARVSTDRPARYGKQLVSHLSRRSVGEWDEQAGRGSITFADARADLSCIHGALLLRVEGPTERLDGLEDVLGRHLVRFGTKDELVVQWVREGGQPGTEQRMSED